MTAQTGACPVQASTARSALNAVEPSCVTSTRRRRSKRSAALPAHGASRSTGMKLPKLRTPRRNGECVIR
jgi:hypothetical protein